MKHLFLIGSVVWFAPGCAGWSMKEPADVVATSDALPVTGRSRATGSWANEGFQLGPYKVTSVERGATRGLTVSLGPTSFGSHRTDYAFAVQGDAGELRAACHLEQKDEGALKPGELQCQCGASDETKITVRTGTEPGEGFLALGGVRHPVLPILERATGPLSSAPLGYRIDGAPDEEPMGAISLDFPGRAWIRRSADAATRTQLGCIFSGLLLFQPIR